MLIFELKKILVRTSSKVALLLLLAVIGVTCYFAMGISWIDENGDRQSGPAAVARLQAARREWSGYLDETAICRVIAENRRIESRYGRNTF